MSAAISEVVARALRTLPPERRGPFLRDLMATAAAGLAATEGERQASEAVYRLADAMVERAAGA
jgi:hypothetical protein